MFSFKFQNELEDALRKRKGQSSDEDLGLPSSPSTSQRNNHKHRAPIVSPYRYNVPTSNQHSPLNLLSVDSSELDDDSFTSTTTAGFPITSSGYMSSSKLNMSFSSTRTSDDELLTPSSDNTTERLSHSAARHKMAIRPKKNAPSRRARISDAVCF